MNINPEEIYNRLESVGIEWSGANAKAELLHECQKSELSEISLGYLDNGCKSMAEAEARARATERYKVYVGEMVEAKREANDAKVRYAAAQAWFEGMRTQAATLRQEMKSLPHTT